jgi:membrane protease YdiL (CAAX protease family)
VTYSLTIVHNSILLALRWNTQADTILRFLQSDGSPWGLVLGGAVVGPLAEEIVFRGFFFQGLRQAHGSTKAVLISSAVFATIHLEPAAFIPTFLLGCTMAFVFDRSNSVWPGTILHFLVNVVGIGALLLVSRLSL